ncbi:ATP-binding protein [Frisingicoccus sp.]|uniref:ATP-binding protein n=1 Tax=Frisingicoccus sp. TaxID=1918627 RepID=UPI003AB8BD3F
MFFGIDNDGNVVGLKDAQTDAEIISRLIKERIMPFPDFVLIPERENGKDLLMLTVYAGRSTPYYYKADGVMEVYIRIGNESVIVPNYVLNQLLLKGMNHTYDALSSEYDFNDYAFSKLRECYKVWTGNSLEEKLFDSFEIRDASGKLTNAGALLADDSPIRHSRLFCTRWNGMDKSGGMVDALDSAEYSGSLIILLNEGVGFVKRNMKIRWKKTANSRIEMPGYCERSVFEALVNALIHRDYLILGSEVHIDIYDDRLTIYSPGGMADGTRIQERDIDSISSTRRNPVLADIFGRLGYMERQGSGFKKITEAYYAAYNYRAELEPKFYSDVTSFQVTLYNLNYGQMAPKTGLYEKKQAVEAMISGLNVSTPTRENIFKLYDNFGFDVIFARADVMKITGLTATPASELMRKLKGNNLIESAKGRGKYKFIEPQA